VLYNSSAAAVTAIWLLFNIYIVSFVRSVRKELMLPCITFTLFVGVISSFAPTLPSMAAGIEIVVQLVEINLSGFAISAAVTLLVFPETSRGRFCRLVGRFVDEVERCLAVKVAAADVRLGPGVVRDEKAQIESATSYRNGKANEERRDAASVAALMDVFNSIDQELKYAHVELGYGIMNAQDLLTVRELLLEILQPIMGLMASIDFLETQISNTALESQREALGREHDAAIKVHELIMDTLRFAVASLLQHKCRSSEQSMKEMSADRLEAGHTPDTNRPLTLADLESRLRAAREERAARAEAEHARILNTLGRATDAADQQIMFFVIQVCSYDSYVERTSISLTSHSPNIFWTPRAPQRSHSPTSPRRRQNTSPI
jgi:hypothetical protein